MNLRKTLTGVPITSETKKAAKLTIQAAAFLGSRVRKQKEKLNI